MKRLAAAAVVAAVLIAPSVRPARGDDGDPRGQVVYVKGSSLWRIDATGRGKAVELVALPDGARGDQVRAIRADAGGHVLVVDVGGTWYWSQIDGGAWSPLVAIGCGAGPATLALDGMLVACAGDKGGTSVKKLGTDVHAERDVPAAGAVAAGAQGARRLIWADSTGVWSAPIGNAGDGAAAPSANDPKKQLAAEPPLAHFSASPDGARALGVYKAADDHDAEILYSFPLDGTNARRKSIRHGVPIEWAWDSTWVLVQDGGKACVMRAVGGEYKCWNGYAAVGIADDGAWGLLLGARDGKAPAPAKPAKGKGKAAAKGAKPDASAPPPPGDEGGESDDAASADDTPVPLPKGPFSLYRARRDGAYTDKPVVIVHDVDGPATWLATPPPAVPAAGPVHP